MHAIMEFDQGVIMGSTWHGLPQYATQDTPVTLEQAARVLSYPVVKHPLYRVVAGGQDKIRGFALGRGDHPEVVLCDYVGPAYEVHDNVELLNLIHTITLKMFPKLCIESVGTLFNGRTAFVNLLADRFAIKGDQSETLNRLVWWNPLGEGSYGICPHSIRVVCNNTLQAARRQGENAGGLRRVLHRGDVLGAFEEASREVGGMLVALGHHQECLTHLTSHQLNPQEVRGLQGRLFPILPEQTEREAANAAASRQVLDNLFEGAATAELDLGIRHTAYGFLQAVTYMVDNPGQINPKSDLTARRWDGLLGVGAEFKQRALNLLVA